MPLDLNRPLNSDSQYSGVSAEVAAALNDVQGNILRPHGRERAAHVFLRFDRDRRVQAGSSIARLAGALTSAKRQAEQAQHRSDEPCVALWLSAQGFRALGFADSELPTDPAFLKGMPARSGRIGDTATGAWEDHLKDPDALLLVASDSDAVINGTIANLLPDGGLIGVKTTKEERGRELRKDGKKFEPFGFLEGLGNPSMVGLFDAWSPDDEASPLYPLRQVLTGFPRGVAGGYGSYFVFRKLEQDVDRFAANVAGLARAIDPDNPDPEYAAALVLGRFKDGTDLLVQGTPGRVTRSDGASFHASDRNGLMCPMQAHVRRGTRHGELAASTRTQRSRLIVRRGMPYRQVEGAREAQGTLFICCQGSIEDQFEIVQGYWLNGSPNPIRRMDALAGLGDRVEQQWPSGWNRREHRPFRFENCIAVKGGEYFFAPPISFLRGLAHA